MQQFGPMSYAGGCSITYPVAVSRLLLLVIRGGGLFSVQFYAKFSFFHMDSCHKSNFRAGKNADFASIAKYQTPHFWYHASVDAKSAFLGCTNMTCDKNTPEKVQILRRGTQTGVDSNEDADYVVGGGENGCNIFYRVTLWSRVTVSIEYFFRCFSCDEVYSRRRRRTHMTSSFPVGVLPVCADRPTDLTLDCACATGTAVDTGR